jgi:hypothetical protein
VTARSKPLHLAGIKLRSSSPRPLTLREELSPLRACEVKRYEELCKDNDILVCDTVYSSTGYNVFRGTYHLHLQTETSHKTIIDVDTLADERTFKSHKCSPILSRTVRLKSEIIFPTGVFNFADPSGRSVAGVAGSNPARGIDVCLLCLYVVLSCVGRGLCDGLITCPEESYRASVCD